MSNTIIENLFKEKDYLFKRRLFKVIKDYKLNIDELVILIIFLNQEHSLFDVKEIKTVTLMSEKAVMEAFSSLMTKGIVSLKVQKGSDGKINETLDLDKLYQEMVSDTLIEEKGKLKTNIFELFEVEFGRVLSPMEYEIINGWIKLDINEELIIGALKEATFNGVNSLRYIDKIIYEWGKKGFKSMNDVNKHLKSKPKEEVKELFDYNWLDEE